MIAMLARPLVKYLIGAAVIALLLWWVYDRGYSSASRKYEAEIAADRAARAEADAEEQRRQQIANSAAKKREADALAEIERQEAELSELRKELRREALQDPDAGKPSLGSDSVQRINKIR